MTTIPQCEWVTDGWPHRQCPRQGLVIVDNWRRFSPTERYCRKHAAMVRKHDEEARTK